MESGGKNLIIGSALFCFMLGALLLMSDALHNSVRFGEYYAVLLLFNGLGLLCLLILIGLNIRSLARALKRRVAGARLTVRMAGMFVVLAVAPALLLYYFSLDFLHRGIDSWFDLGVEQALEDSLALSRLALDTRMKTLLRETEEAAAQLADVSNAAMAFEIDDYRRRSGAEEFTLLTRQGGIIASSSSDTTRLVPASPDDAVLFQVQQGSSYIGLDVRQDNALAIRVVVNVPVNDFNRAERLVQAIFPVAERVNELTNSVQTAFIDYQELAYLRRQLKLSFIVVLTIVLLFSILSAVWAAFYSARRLAAPIRDLAEGTRSVAEGDYTKQLPVNSRDELGVLVASFNAMTRAIGGARDAAAAQQGYLEAVLGRLSSGVWVLDADRTIRMANIRSSEILGVASDASAGHSLAALGVAHPYLQDLLQAFSAHIGQGATDWRQQGAIYGNRGKQIITAAGAAVAVGEEQEAVHVIVFDDVTALVQGQRDAAWTEMARRLAHEIKNPLTPIKLAAERLRHKYLGADLDTSGETTTLDRLTTTIINQVDTMREMVDSFAEYARPPTMRRRQLDINQLLKESLDLYGSADPAADITFLPATGLPPIKADPNRLRQVFNNLIDNAIAASPAGGQKPLTVTTAWQGVPSMDCIEIRIKDAGCGLDDALLDSLFEPYITTKPQGTGLGLPIVKKIIEEHGGTVWLENNTHAHDNNDSHINSKGACAIIRLPVAAGAA